MIAIKYFSFILLLILPSIIHSQIPDTVWTKTFGGALSEWGNQVQQTTDGGYILVGWTRSFGSGYTDLWLIKTSHNGDTLWTKTYGGNSYDRGYSVQQTNDGGYIVAGMTASGSNSGVWVIKTDSLGEAIWTKTLGSGYANSIEQTSDGGYIIVGDKSIDSNPPYPRDILLIKTDSSGNTIWSKTFRGDYPINLGVSVKQITEDEYVFLGYSYNIGIDKCLLIETDDLGNTIWTKTFDLGVVQDEAFSFQQTTDGGYIIAGITTSFSGNGDVWILKTDASGNLLWTKVFEEIDYVEGANSIQQTVDGGYIITGFTKPAGADYFDMLLIKTDANGEKLWTKTLGGNLEERANSIQLTKDGGYIITGYTESFGAGNSDIWLLKFNHIASPDIQISKDSLNLTFDDISFTSRDSLVIYNTGNASLNIDTIYSTNASGFILDIVLQDTTIHTSVTWRNSYYNPFVIESGDSAKLVFTYPLWIPKTFDITETWRDTIIILNNSLNNGSLAIPALIDFPVGIANEINELPLKFSLQQNFPNPFNPSTKIKFQIPDQFRNDRSLVTLKVYDVLGNEIATLVNEEKAAGNHEVEFDGAELPSGIYFYQLKVGGPETSSGQVFIETKKMVLIK